MNKPSPSRRAGPAESRSPNSLRGLASAGPHMLHRAPSHFYREAGRMARGLRLWR